MTGLGLYGGHRGNRWLKNRIRIFKQFVLPSLLNQTSKNFVLWASFRYEDRDCPIIKKFKEDLDSIGDFKTVFTFNGVCFWDDKYSDEVAYTRLIDSVHGSMGDLINVMGEAETILMTIQPSDDCYIGTMVEDVQRIFHETDYQVVAYQKGYVMDYVDRKLAEWNPGTNPPFFTIKFPRKTFVDPYQHVQYTGPYKSHEYVGDELNLLPIYDRGYLVGTHGENISTIFKHPFTGGHFHGDVKDLILERFGLHKVPNLKIRFGIRKAVMRRLPHGWQRKLRYIFGEKSFARFYNWIRS